MIIYTKYSNERNPKFRIRTDIIKNADGSRKVRKTAADPAAKGHIEAISCCYHQLKADLDGTGLTVNQCEQSAEGVYFPYLTGMSLETSLDLLWKQKKEDELIREIERYFAMFALSSRNSGAKGTEFVQTPEFQEIFGTVSFSEPQLCRKISDIDMIFSNAIICGQGYELIDYEWTFTFPIPVKFIQYRCLHYYLCGNEMRRGLEQLDLYQHFGISEEEQQQFAAMEEKFQQYMLGAYIPYRKLYDAISEGVIDLNTLVKKESTDRHQNMVEIYFDDGRGFGIWNYEKRRSAEQQRLELQIALPSGTKAVRVDPCSEPCVVRISRLRQKENELRYTSNGYTGGNGDLIFDTADPQILFQVSGTDPVQVSLIVEPMNGVTRELILNQYGKLRKLQPGIYVNKVKKIIKRK